MDTRGRDVVEGWLNAVDVSDKCDRLSKHIVQTIKYADIYFAVYIPV